MGFKLASLEPREFFRLSARKQSVHIAEDEDGGLKRVLRWWDLLTFGLASTLGAGIFVTAGVAQVQAGGGLIFSFLVAGFAALLSGLCYAEYAARIPVSGSAYTFIYVTLGELIGWLVGWNMTLEYAVSASAVAQGWASYFTKMMINLGWPLPDWISGMPLWGPFSFSPLALSIIVLCTVVLLFGMQESSYLNMTVTIVNLIIIVFIIVVGAMHFDIANWGNFWANADNSSPAAGVAAAAATVFFAFIGFDSVTTLAGEVKKPKTDLPLAILATLVIVTSLYVGVSVVLTGLVTYLEVDQNAPLSSAFSHIHLPWAATVVAVGSVTTLTATTLSSLLGQPRVFFQMAQDGLLFETFGTVSARGVPITGTLVTLALSGALALFFDLDALAHMISAGTLLAYCAVAGGIAVMRFSLVPATPKYGSDGELVEVPQSQPRYSLVNFGPRWEALSYAVHNHIALVVGLYVLVSAGFGVFLSLKIWYMTGVFAAGLFLIYLVLQLQTHTNQPKSFSVPLVPLVPLISVTFNIVLLVHLPYDALIRVLIWSVIGMLVYMFYGVHYSHLNQDYLKLKKDASEERLITGGGVTYGSRSSDEKRLGYSDDDSALVGLDD
eukprot:TRINITY_DN1671_c0_g1_i2.p1 TRINITY_DN1671_c0_g1~~TRINITY_DN1671_c0_g1_i2.p1  ORF type:complete len:609 (-),score=89.75 TRINITY_DN1671_c0_g1_i2:89-1915(-)